MKTITDNSETSSSSWKANVMRVFEGLFFGGSSENAYFRDFELQE